MKIALIGATGFIGNVILEEALMRGHSVTAIARDVSKLAPAERLTATSIDVLDVPKLAEALRGNDAVVASFNPTKDTGPAGSKAILEAVRGSGVNRVIYVGGAGSLLLEDGRRYAETELFPDEWRAGSLALAGIYDWLKETVRDVDWVFFPPADIIAPGPRTGKFRLGKDHLLKDAEGKGLISVADYAVAMLDEVENPAHHRERFTIAY